MALLELFWPALLGGVVVAMAAGPLGAMLVWRRLAYFGDSLAHAALLGVGLGLVFSVPVGVPVVLVSLAVAVCLSRLLAQREQASDALLAVLTYGFLSMGLVVISLHHGSRVDVMAFLFGDLLAITAGDLLPVVTGALAVLAVMAWFWHDFLACAVSEELAAVDGLPVARLRTLLLLLLALAIAAAMRVVGVLLVTALLVIPASAARYLARTPEQMAGLASLLGVVSVGLGLGASCVYDTPAGPSAVVCCCLLFFLAGITGKLRSVN